MSVAAAAAAWIKVVADDERKRDAIRIAEDEVITRKADAVRRDGRRLVDELQATMRRDVQAFCDEFAGDATRAIVVEASGPNGGFVVRKPAPAAVSLTLMPSLDTASMLCHYRFTLHGLPPREDRIDIVFAADGSDALRMKHDGTGQLFTTADALSQFLLVPVMTGRPR
jgi:hypothetical protein